MRELASEYDLQRSAKHSGVPRGIRVQEQPTESQEVRALGMDPFHHLRTVLYSVEPAERRRSRPARRCVLSPRLCGVSRCLLRYSQGLVPRPLERDHVRAASIQRGPSHTSFPPPLSSFPRKRQSTTTRSRTVGDGVLPAAPLSCTCDHAHCSDDVPDSRLRTGSAGLI